MGLIQPNMPDFDLDEWKALPYPERVRLSCQDWAVHGFGTPLITHLFYIFKIALYIGGFFLFCWRADALGGPSTFGDWWYEPEAFVRMIIWTMAYEALGLGCGSGPLTGRFMPPFSAMLHFPRPGTIRLPPFPSIPGTAGDTRTVADAGLFVLHYILMFWALWSSSIDAKHLIPLAIVLPILSLRDKTVFLASRGEHYFVTLLIITLALEDLGGSGSFIAGAKALQFCLWWGAAASKLTHHFPSVVSVMVSNAPAFASPKVRNFLYKDAPHDLRYSRGAQLAAHGGTFVEFAFPLILFLSVGGTWTTIGLIAMVIFHGFILTSVPMGVPLEWNVAFIYSGFVLYGHHAEVRPWEFGSPLIAVVILVSGILMPIAGNLRPDRVSFLPSMRYYAGNWAYSQWMFRGDSIDKLDANITKATPESVGQATALFDAEMVTSMLSRGLAFRAMHLHGRVLHDLVPKAVDDIEEYEIRDGEVIAGMALGWNFGDGHLHNEQFLAAVQSRCQFEPGELRCIMVESQPIHRQEHHWRIVDAATGLIEEGYTPVSQLLEQQPWPTANA